MVQDFLHEQYFLKQNFRRSAKPWVKNSTSIQTKVCHSWYILSNTIGLRSIPIKWQTTGIDLIGAHIMSPLQRVTLKHNEGDTYTLKLRSKTLQFSCGFMWGIYLFSSTISQLQNTPTWCTMIIITNMCTTQWTRPAHGSTQKTVAKMAIYARNMKE